MDVRTDDRGKFFTPRVTKESVATVIRTTDHLIVGQIYVRPDHRLKDELNSTSEPYLAITDAKVYDQLGQMQIFETSFLIVAASHVIFISPLDAIRDETPPPWAQRHEEEAT
jgi:hypothetical protein